MKTFSKLTKLLTIIAMMSASTALAQPIVKTDTRFARGATMAFGRLTLTANGASVKERGFCWGETKTPTINDAHSKEYLSNNGLIFVMRNLTPATMYYARAYALTADSTVVYGDVIKFCTLPMGTVGWGYDNGGSAAENDRINAAVGSCADYWNKLTNITGLYLNVHYGAQTPTADCSYGGWMRVGPNASYQKTGTIMHEALHAIGVGTHSIWNGAGTPLRAGNGTGQWLGDRANDVLRFWDNNNTATLTGDGTHMWPYGINGAHEDSGSEVLYMGTSLLAQAIGEDGLPCTTQRPFGSPAYVFTQEDDVKYYIKNESEDCGLYSSYLVEDANRKLVWKTMTADEAAANDQAAWYVTFTPATQYYHFRNASTGNYIHVDNLNTVTTAGFSAIVKNTPSEKESFHLMRSRIDVTSSTGSLITSQRGYWIIAPSTSSANPPAMTAATDGSVKAQAFDLGNTAKQQRWLILSADQAKAMEDSGTQASRELFNKNKAFVEQIISTPHWELVEGTDNSINETVAQLTAQCNEATSSAEISTLAEQILEAGKNYLLTVEAKETEHPFDLTVFLANPNFDIDASGWTTSSGYAWNHSEVEYYEKNATFHQTIKNMPKGRYVLHMQGFQRPGSYTDTYNQYAAGTDNVKVKLFINTTTTSALIKNIMEDRQPARVHNDDKQMSDGKWIPNTMASAQAYFAKGLYDNEVVAYWQPNTGSFGDLRVGMSGTNNSTSWWTIFDNFRLGYCGPLTDEEVTGIRTTEFGKTVGEGVVYNLSGQRVEGKNLPAGVYIVNGRKVAF